VDEEYFLEVYFIQLIFIEELQITRVIHQWKETKYFSIDMNILEEFNLVFNLLCLKAKSNNKHTEDNL